MTYSDARDRFINLLQDRENTFSKNMFKYRIPDTFSVISGYKYDKVIRTSDDGSRSSYCYINKATGGILKGSWKHVEDKRPRGNIYNDENPLAGTDVYGVNYLTGTNYHYDAETGKLLVVPAKKGKV